MSVVTPPARKRGSVRRTTSYHSSFPDGPHGNIRILCKGRDLLTGQYPDHCSILSSQTVEFILAPDATLVGITDVTSSRVLDSFVGLRAGKPLRDAAAAHLP